MRLPYGRQWIDEEDEAAVLVCLRSDWLTQGPAVEAFEAALAAAVGVRHAVAVSSGTAALHLAYLALGVGPGDAILTSPITFAATANAALCCGARPEFADICPKTICLAPEALEEKLVAGLRPAVVTPVHFGGLPSDLERLRELRERFGFRILEDACHALGARYLFHGAWGPVGDCRGSDAAVFSFHPVKHITTGEGGAVVTNDAALADAVRRLRSHGIVRSGFRVEGQARGSRGEERPWYYEVHDLGFNYRLTDLQCALGRSQLGKLERFVRRRRELACAYAERLSPLSASGALVLPAEPIGRLSSWHLYPVRIPGRRDETYRRLLDAGVGSQVHYIPVHLHPYYRERFQTGPGDYPAAEAYFEEALSLPLFPAMGDADVDRVADALEAALAR